MSKYYRVLKDSPLWEEGAILSNDGSGYAAISDLWDTCDTIDSEYLSTRIVENPDLSDWFERVYHIKGLGKGKYVTKKAAKALHNKDYKEV